MDEKIAQALAKETNGHAKARAILRNMELEPSYNKYGVSPKEERTYHDGTLFASKGEMERWDDLLKVQRAGQIKDLRRQVTFVLQEEFIHRQWGDVQHLIYVADFVYYNVSFRKEYQDRIIVEDSKGKFLTKEYRIKRKLFLYKYAGYPFFEV